MKSFATEKKKQLDNIAVSGTHRHSRAADIWLRLVRDKSAVVSLVLLGIIILLAIFADVLFDKSAITTQNIDLRNCPPSWEHWFGTDLYGRDIFIRMVFGSRVSLLIGIVTMVASMVIGGLLGAVAAYFGKATDSIIMRLTDMFMAIPETLLALCVVAAMGASEHNLTVFREHYSYQTIGPDKLNQLRHAKYFKNFESISEHMKHHAAIIRPKFDVVLYMLDKEIEPLGIGKWNKPNGGYFISFDALPGCAKRIVSLAKEAGVVMTGAGATFPYGKDPKDSNIRIAPTFPSVDELRQAMEIFCVCVKLASVEVLLNK